jgi:hypothetical protein
VRAAFGCETDASRAMMQAAVGDAEAEAVRALSDAVRLNPAVDHVDLHR